MSVTMRTSSFFTPPFPGMFGFESRTNAPHASYGFSLAGSGACSKPHDDYGYDEGRWVDCASVSGVFAGVLGGLGTLSVYAG